MDSLNKITRLFSRRKPWIPRRDLVSGPIGLDLSLESLHMVQLSFSGGVTHLQGRASVDYVACHRAGQLQGSNASVSDQHSPPSVPPSLGNDVVSALSRDRAALKDLVSQALHRSAFRGRRVVAAMPASLVRVMPVSYQIKGSERDEDAIAALMAERLGSDAQELVIDYMPVQTLADVTAEVSTDSQTAVATSSGVGRERLALVAVCRQDTVLQFADCLSYAGLDVVAIEIGPIAIARLIGALQKERPPQNTLVLNCGRRQSFLTVLADDRLLADDQIDLGECDLITEVAQRLELSDDLASQLLYSTSLAPDQLDDSGRMLVEIIKPRLRSMVREIDRGLVYAGSESRGTRRNQIYLLGGLARWNGIAELLESIVNVPVSLIPGPAGLFDDTEEGAVPELAVATGLALNSWCGRE